MVWGREDRADEGQRWVWVGWVWRLVWGEWERGAREVGGRGARRTSQQLVVIDEDGE